MEKAIYWVPRVLSILLLIFVSLFALDVFGQPNWFLALLIHLIPSFILLLITIFAWKYEKLGGWLFILLCLAAMWFFLPPQTTTLIFALPLLLIGFLFLVNGFMHQPKKEK